jgi:hypothetical protein
MNTAPKPLADVDDHELVISLGSKVCPACGGGKKRAHTFCGPDYYKLDTQTRKDLYRRLGSGYREAIAAALRILHPKDADLLFITVEV